MNGATLFSGFGGVDIGMEAAGVSHLWGIEYDEPIAEVARLNGLNTLTADILKCDPRDFEKVDLLHASPPCPNFSNAKANRAESENDLALARKVIEFIRVIDPEVFTLENVYGYRKAYSLTIIYFALLELGYFVDGWKLNAADYGVPQTRERLIIIARKDKKPIKPTQTHYSKNKSKGKKKKGQLSLFEVPWVGWYEAIEDLVPTLPDSKFADWQLNKLPESFKDCFVVHTHANSGTDGKWGDQPITTLAVQKMPDKAILFSSSEMSNTGRQTRWRTENEPSATILASDGRRPSTMPSAFVMNAANPNGNETKKYRLEDEPIKTITAGDSSGIKAFVVNGTANDRGQSGNALPDDSPIFTVVSSSYKKIPRAFTDGRVVKLTPRALARLQSFPDWYQLPDGVVLACKGIGNAVPCLLYQKIVESLKD